MSESIWKKDLSFRKKKIDDLPETAESLRVGNVYFSVQFEDEAMLVPILEAWVFIGQNLTDGEPDDCYFQDFASYAAGVRHTTPGETDAVFQAGAPTSNSSLFQPIFNSTGLASCHANAPVVESARLTGSTFSV